jgi:hypothetical protein
VSLWRRRRWSTKPPLNPGRQRKPLKRKKVKRRR